MQVETDSETELTTSSEAKIPRVAESLEITEEAAQAQEAAGASDAEDQDETIRVTNAYPGASNTIGSIHQRQWFLSLDRLSSGFVKSRTGNDEGRWTRRLADAKVTERQHHGDRRGCEVAETTGFDTFIVRGRDVERSVVTGRLAKDVYEDEGVSGYEGRKMWRPVVE